MRPPPDGSPSQAEPRTSTKLRAAVSLCTLVVLPLAWGAKAEAQASADVVDGWKQYEANCSRCHGQDALGSALAPDLRKSVKGAVSRDAFVQTAMNGRADKGMPAFAKQLEPSKIDHIYAYVMARSSGKLAAGRPGT
jgi:mono/diheme cytochrome c family protein